MPMEWVNALVQGLLLGGLYALLACGLSLVFGVMRIVNIAHGDLAVFAAFLGLVFVDRAGLSVFVTLALVVPLMAVIGYVLQRGLLGPALRRGAIAPLLVTFGVAVVLQNVLQELFSADTRSLDSGGFATASLRITDQLAVGWLPLLTFLVGVAAIAAVQLVLSRTRLGRAMRATSDDPEAAGLMGIDNRHVYGIATAIALATVGLAGVFLGMRTQFSPTLGPLVLIFAFEAVIIGGLGSLWGTLAGGIVLGVAQTLGAQVQPAYGVLAGHLVFLLVLALRPQGLFPRTVTT
jgi:branched-chain amino acid transport system permease protein